ncbi:MAG: glycine--tRNA ligase [Candidatus Micrarchaeota archaeon]|nr:glycine--tRNA ligase [Candidatus Micrarchaeota archaeon]
MHEKLFNMMARRAVIIPTSEIYNPIAGFYDYGPVGLLIKRKIVDMWREIFIKEDGFLEIDGSTLLPEIALKASGHVDHFNDPLTECRKCHRRYRADHLLEEAKKIDASHMTNEQMTAAIRENGIKCSVCAGELDEVKPFNMMFKTSVGAVDGSSITLYLRPETAQNIFMDFNKLFNTHGAKLPLGIGQVGRSYRNEISPRQGLIRVREFEQMEVEFFFDPSEDDSQYLEQVKDIVVPLQTREQQRRKENFDFVSLGSAYENGDIPVRTVAYFMAKEQKLLNALGIMNFRFRHLMEDETPHYSGGNFDVEIPTKFGWVEVISLAYRTNYDLARHKEFSGKNLEVTFNNKKVLAHVVEPSIGLGRLFWCALEHAYVEDKERGWDWLNLPPRIAPYDAYILPLMKKDNLPEKAKEVYAQLLTMFDVYYDASGSIGRRYAKADEIGVPYCVTIDYQTLEDETVTVRFRNDGKQARIPLDILASELMRFKYNGTVEGAKSGLPLIQVQQPKDEEEGKSQ